MLSIVYFLIVLSVLVIVHEFGHFIVAKRIGVRVEKFSFGFGPKIFSIIRGETEYLVSAIPLGGYVKMAGDEPGKDLTGKSFEFLSRKIADRFKIIFAGPLLNYVLAFLIFSVIFMFGSPTLTTEVGSLLEDYPAKKSGIILGDKILKVDNKDVKYWEDMTAIIHDHLEGPIKLSLERKGETFDLELRPVIREVKDIFGKSTKIALLGIAPSQKIENIRYGFFQSFGMGLKKLIVLTNLTYKAIWYIITGRMSVKESMTGPIGIFIITGKAAQMGLIYLINLTAMLSASLAIFNLLPLPVLDGGHILFLIVEKIRGKPLSMKAQEIIANIGIGFLILLTVFIFYNDIMKFKIFDGIVKFFKR
ncbi:MAG: RIP metalloprotease RseP [Omnitrophica bacterium RIFCSPLOWO2_02_FULL_45_16]|nr:MAG: RIP metalloprotease RseP [Omnitrophica bacterium RIFCSPHIGHO2_02_FULL_46_20]OGW92917.1 MAG: RIP metalloprotease RseP [Omnitrophica bacterium RIFCSPLOWO2_12_FULL_45_13]OGW93120.1 MAG: RIP metalloprotease RseP [Omnitrophica bacterium RIFCSPLOWO2_01_FULL_45_24]OGX00377.1 MAG: RIP metalloprotease RseP [Omnitrophica bacterium RIFCSPLOWO2_02_FULL_45_16]